MSRFTIQTPFYRKPISSQEILLNPKESTIIDLLPYATAIHYKYRQYFRPPEPGIYLPNKLKPLLYFDRCYYRLSDLINPIKTLENIREDIVDKDYNIVITKRFMERHSDLLLKEPTIPVRALEILKATILQFFYKRDYRFIITQHLNQEGLDAYINRQIEVYDDIDSLINHFYDFIGDDFTYIYDLSFIDSELTIQKIVDWRIWEWTVQQEQKKRQ